MTKLVFTILLAILLLNACNNGPTNIESLKGNYEYTAYDSTGVPAVHGNLNITRKDSILISGYWVLQPAGSTQDVGPQNGSGSFGGWIEHDTTVYINMNPGWADNNVFLHGIIHDKDFTGTWTWSTEIGETNKGKFEARKILLAL